MSHIHRKAPTVVVTKSASNKKDHVSFAQDPVTSVSRPANIEESWAAYEFECHARRCAHCNKPYDVYRSGELLCNRGHRLAQDVATYLYNHRGETVSTKKEDHQYVRVEIPAAYDEVRDLLRAIERSLRHRHREPFVSMDRSYYVAPRTPERKERPAAVKVDQPVKPKRPHSGEIVDWPRTLERRATVQVAGTKKRGSLYEADIAQQQRDRAKYNVEIREPNKGSSGYYR